MNALPLLAAVALTALTVQVSAADAPAAPAVPAAPAAPAAPGAIPRERIERQLRQAQEQLDRSAHEVADLSMKLSAQPWFDMEPPMTLGLPQVVLGINIGGAKSDGADGAAIVSVSPGGPADLAGLKANDVIVSFNGTPLNTQAGSSPRQRLLTLMHGVKPGAAVPLEYRRDGKVQKAQIVPQNLSAFMTVDHEMRDMGRGMREFNIAMRRESDGFGSAELCSLSPALGRYFGTDKGLLVVRAPRDERLQLQDGDVIMDIDGRVPNGASHAAQILNSYRAGEKFKLHIMRQQKRVELLIDMPENAA